MGVFIDQNEGRNTDLRDLADGVWTLDVPGVGDGSYRYDILVQTGIREFRFKRKRFPSDFVASWKAGYLERQLSYVDALIFEYDPMEPDLPVQGPRESDVNYSARLESWGEWKLKAWKHMMALSASMWVIYSDGPHATMALMRHIEANPTLPVRSNLLKMAPLSPRQRVLNALVGVNPMRPLDHGGTLGAEAEKVVDWRALYKALRLDQWTWKGSGRRVMAAGGAFRVRMALEGGIETKFADGENGTAPSNGEKDGETPPEGR